ncbi:hypothetical protein [Luteolibacter sp.]|uniref:hypothetical protein n=1 Tax=Luteolibacter sp. TaxID=1962973 RepID=UPI003266234B
MPRPRHVNWCTLTPFNCRAQELDPEDYLTEVIKRLPHNATVKQAAALTPARIAAERRASDQQAA